MEWFCLNWWWIYLAIVLVGAIGSQVLIWLGLSKREAAQKAEAEKYDWRAQLPRLFDIPVKDLLVAEATSEPPPFVRVESPDVMTAARLSAVCVAAYPIESTARNALFEQLEETGWECRVWGKGGSSGVILYHRKRRELIIGVAGTDDWADVVYDSVFVSKHLGEWGDIVGIDISSDARNVGCPSGFTTATLMAHQAILAKATEIGVDFETLNKVFIAGHSLGGTIARILQMTSDFAGSVVYTFGSAKPLSRAWKYGKVPFRDSVRVVKILDPVQWVPPFICKHVDREKIIISFANTFTQKIPFTYSILVLLFSVFYWSIGLVFTLAGLVGFTGLFAFLGVKSGFGVQSSHLIKAYFFDLLDQW